MITARFAVISLAALLALLSRCSILTGGAGGETTNGYVQGFLFNDDGSPAVHARVSLVPVNYNPVTDPPIPDSLTDTIGPSGTYSFATSIEGFYTIEAVNVSLNKSVLITGIGIVKKDTVFVPLHLLRKPGTIKAMLPDSVNAVNGYVYIPGTDIFTFLNGNDSVAILDYVSAGKIPVLSYAVTSRAIPRVLRYNIQVPSGDTVVIFNPAWKYARQLLLNTTTSGAGVPGNVYDFPVLIRLTSGNFNFAEAKANGDDLRFTKPDNTFLPYEIERWNASQAQAEVWVKVDTVYGNDSTHAITMYWGNLDALNASSASMVFDTDATGGFQGVWHLGEGGNSAPGGYKDATPNSFALTGSSMMHNAEAEGIIGRAQKFIGDSTYILGPAPQKISGNVSFTVSFWTSFSPAAARSWILCFGSGQAAAEMCHFLINPNGSTQFGLSGGPGIQPSQVQNIFDASSYQGKWSLVTTVYNAPDTSLATSINGVLMDKRTVLPADIIASGGLCISRNLATQASDDGFYGMLDEVRLYNTTVSIDWIRLSYMNQKADEALVNVK